MNKKLRNALLMIISCLTVAALAITGTVAYLKSEDSAVNVMTMGNVQIEQIEQERDANGDLVPFSQAKPAFPAVGTVNWAADGVEVNGTEYKVFSDDLKNVIDKIVTVKNTGKSDAFVRTIIAIEAPEGDPDNLIHVNVNGTGLTYTPWAVTEIDGVDYVIATFTYDEALAPGAISAPSLMQVFLDKAATNEDVAKFGNTWDILVLSQAVQVEGFADAKTALDTAFGAITATSHPWAEAPESISTYKDLKAALAAGKDVTLTADITGDGKSIVLPGSATATIDLNGHTLTNAVSGAPAIVNYGDLTITGDGAIVNGTNDVNKSHTIRNYGTLTVNGGNIGTFDTAGAAIVNDGTATINGGNFASKQENVKADGLCAYVFINNGDGTMTINDATVDGQTHGLFGAYNGEIIVNGGYYNLDGNGGLGCYVVYATGADTVVTLNDGIVYTTAPRNNRYYFVYDNGNYFNEKAVETGKIVENGTKVYLNAKTAEVNGTDKAAVLAAIEAANPGDTVKLTEDTTIAGWNANQKLVIEKDIVLDLGGHTITTESGWGGIDLKGGCSIKNGTINHTGNTAAIKAFQVESIENVTINVTQTEGKEKGGIVLQNSAEYYIGSIKNVTIIGATNGIETYNCGNRPLNDLAIGSMENVVIDATHTGMEVLAPVGTVTNCDIEGDVYGINMHLKGAYNVSITLVNTKVSGATGIYAWDEAAYENPGQMVLTYDAASEISSIETNFASNDAEQLVINAPIG